MALAPTSNLLPAWLARLARLDSPTGASAAGSTRWTQFRAACRVTPYYRRNPPQRGSTLALAQFYAELPDFVNPAAAPAPEPAMLGAPWEPPLRAVALEPWFRLQPPDHSASATITLMSPAIEPILAARPELLAGPVRSLRSVAVSAMHRRWRIPSLTNGLIVFTGCSRPPLTAAHRDALWRAFGVPIFEQFRGFQGEILAAECEAHCGLHVNQDTAVWEQHPDPASRELLVTSLVNLRHPAYRLATGYHGIFDYRTCDCGLALPRIVWTRACAVS